MNQLNRRLVMVRVKLIIAILVVCYLVGCTSVNVRKVDSKKYPISNVCIIKNPKVLVNDFLSVVEKRFLEHDIEVDVYSENISQCCEYILKYTARRSWDISPYLAYAELELLKHNKIIGSAMYKHIGGSMSLALNKWASTSSKMTPVINDLLSDFNVSPVLRYHASKCVENRIVETKIQLNKEDHYKSPFEIIDSNGHIIFVHISKKSRLRIAGISINDEIIKINGDVVTNSNLESIRKILNDFDLEISIHGKGTARIRGYEVVKSF